MQNRKKTLKIVMWLLIIMAILNLCVNVYATCDAANGRKNGACKGALKEGDTGYKPCSLCGHTHDYEELGVFSKLGLTAYDMACKSASNITGQFSSPVDNGDGGSGFDMTTMLLFDTNQEPFKTVWGFAETTYNSLTLFGSLLITVYFLLELAEVELNEGFTYETFAKHSIKTILAFIIMRNGFTIVTTAVGLCSSLLKSLAETSALEVGGFFECSLCPYWNACTMFGSMGVFFTNMLSWLAIMICFLTISIMCWVRIFDILIRVVGAPIGMSDMLKGGMDSNAVRYLKKLMASVLQGACIFICLICYQRIAGELTGSLLGTLGNVLSGLAAITTVKKTGAIANDIMGVR